MYCIFGSSLLGLAFLFTQEQKNENMPYIMLATSVGLGTPCLVTKIIAEKKLNKAVYNYNLYIMGIQIQNN